MLFFSTSLADLCGGWLSFSVSATTTATITSPHLTGQMATEFSCVARPLVGVDWPSLCLSCLEDGWLACRSLRRPGRRGNTPQPPLQLPQRRYLSCLVALPPSPFSLPTCACAAQVVVQWHPSLVVMVATPSPPPPPPPQTAVLFAHLCATCTPDVRMLFLPSVDSIPLHQQHQHQQQQQLFPSSSGGRKVR